MEQWAQKLAEKYTPNSVAEMVKMSSAEAEDWLREILNEENKQAWYSTQVYGSSYGPPLGIIIAEETGISMSDDASECYELEDALAEQAEKNMPDRRVFVYTDDNCIWLVAI
jgi:hypothetical protein